MITALKNHLGLLRTGEEGEPHFTGWMVRRSLDPRDLAISCSIAFKSSNKSFAARIEAQDHLYAGHVVF
jgi:hypothetical protein